MDESLYIGVQRLQQRRRELEDPNTERVVCPRCDGSGTEYFYTPIVVPVHHSATQDDGIEYSAYRTMLSGGRKSCSLCQRHGMIPKHWPEATPTPSDVPAPAKPQ